ncbi:MAG TPA: tRNA-dihydrouridine synthase family protein [Victivallales bacterium]|nr:tRNA-dihydrouridine synthase family protein [Victivallales bacterium]
MINKSTEQNSNNLHEWLKPLALTGGKMLSHRIMPGPMEGVMSPLFCKVINELNLVDYWITPFIGLSTAPPRLSILRKKLDQFISSGMPTIVQILCSNPETAAKGAKQINKLDITGINLNFACPSKRVLASSNGSSLLLKPELMLKIIESIKQECPELSISLKLRTGYSSSDEFKTFIPLLINSGIDFIMLHFRTAMERYNPVENGPLRIAEAVKLASPIPIIASGDIFTLDTAEEMYNISSCQGITVARGILKDPFLIRRIESYLKKEKLNMEGDSKLEFSRLMGKTVRKSPSYYIRSNFLGLLKSIWGINSPNFKKLINLPDEQIINYF